MTKEAKEKLNEKIRNIRNVVSELHEVDSNDKEALECLRGAFYEAKHSIPWARQSSQSLQ